MNFTEIFKFLSESYGGGGLVLSVLIILLFLFLPYLFNKNNKNMKDGLNEVSNKLTDAIKEENKDLIKGLNNNQKSLIDNQFKLFNDLINNRQKEHIENLNNRDTVSIPIQNKINHLKDFYKASRVSVFEFHNSLVNLNGLPFKWYDVIYESITKGVSSISAETKNMPFNILIPIILQVNEGEIAIFNKDNIEDFYNQSSVLYDFCIKHEINDMIVAPLINKDMQLFGILVLEYSGNNHLDYSNLSVDDVELEAHAISTLLEL